MLSRKQVCYTQYQMKWAGIPSRKPLAAEVGRLNLRAWPPARGHCTNCRISSCSSTVSKVPVPAGICISGFRRVSSSHTLG